MKLRNKKTGETRDVCKVLDMKQEDGVLYKYYSLAELNEEWEDWEEPTYYYFIQDDGRIGCDAVEPYNHKSKVEEHKSIGNYFETKEEAERVAEKLKAWTRLNDKGFKFVEHQIHGMTEDGEGDGCAYFEFDKPLDKSDLDLLFGGEE